MRTTFFTLLTLLLVASCESAPSGPDSLPEAVGPADSQPDETVAQNKAQNKAQEKRKKARNNARKLRSEIEDKEHEQHKARLEFDLGRAKGAAALASAEYGVGDARLDLEIAELALAAFVELEMPMKLGRIELNLDRSKQSVVEARQNLEGMVQIYDDEVEARSKDEILLRSERRLEFSERELALATQRAGFERETEIPNERKKLERAVRKAARGLDKVEAELGQARLSGEIDALDQAASLAKIEKELDKLKTSLRKAEADAEEKS